MTEAWSESEAPNREPAARSASAAATETVITARRAAVSGRARQAPTTTAAIGTRIPCDLKHAASAAHRTEAATAQHRAVLPTQVATSNPAIARLTKTAKRRSAVRTFLNVSRPGYVATRMMGTTPPALRVAAWPAAGLAS